MANLVCDIVTPAAKLFSDESSMVIVPGVEGEMGFLYHHVPLVSALSDGVVRIHPAEGAESDAGVRRFALQGGYVEVTGTKVIVLADRALPVAEIDAASVQEELARLEARAADLSAEEVKLTTIPADIEWCKVRLSAAGA